MHAQARHGLEVGIGLALLGVQRWMTVRPGIEAELDRLGLGPLAEASRRVGTTVSGAVSKVAAGMAPSGA